MPSPVKVWRNQKHIALGIGKVGSIISWTIIRVPPGGFAYQAPYPVVLVRLEGGKMVTGQLVDWSPAHLIVGQRVITVIRRIVEPQSDDVIPYGIKIKPLSV